MVPLGGGGGEPVLGRPVSAPPGRSLDRARRRSRTRSANTILETCGAGTTSAGRRASGPRRAAAAQTHRQRTDRTREGEADPRAGRDSAPSTAAAAITKTIADVPPGPLA